MEKKTANSFELILQNLPKKILHNRNNNIVAECILYDISREICLNFVEVAYFAYNPDFNLCKGLAGMKKKEINTWENDPWQNISEFENLIKNTEYNKKIKKTEFCTTISKNNFNEIVNEIKKSIEMDYAKIYSWNLQNNNIGILLYQLSELAEEQEVDKIENAAVLLSFCPIC